jgi:hypothetical protein
MFLLEGTGERSERRGLLWMAPDVITFVITIPVYGQCLETIKFKRSDAPMTEVTKQDVVAFRNSLITEVSAKTANHDLKASNRQTHRPPVLSSSARLCITASQGDASPSSNRKSGAS